MLEMPTMMLMTVTIMIMHGGSLKVISMLYNADNGNDGDGDNKTCKIK